MRFRLFYVTTRGYISHSAFMAADLREACAKHCAEWACKKVSAALMMRGPDGRRYSFFDSKVITKAAA
jgi:hypothetical protein